MFNVPGHFLIRYGNSVQRMYIYYANELNRILSDIIEDGKDLIA